MKNIAVIPARSGSKRLPKKNYKSFNSRNLVEVARDKCLASGIFDEIINTTGLKDFHAKEPGEKGRSRKENLEELVSAASGFNPIGEDADDDRNELEIFLDQASIDAGENQADIDEDAIQMMTLHSAKGLEFPFVFMAGC